MASMDDELRVLAQSVAHADDIEAFVRPILKLVNRCSGLESVYLTMIDLDNNQQRVWFVQNEGTLDIPEGLTVPWADTLCKRALEEGRYLTNDVPRCWGDSEAAKALKLQTYASVPVHAFDNSLFGTLCGASHETLQVSDDTIDLLHLCAELIAAQLARRDQLVSAERRAEDAETRLNKVALGSQISRQCLEASSLRIALSRVAELLNGEIAWSRIDAFRVSDGTIDNLNDANQHSVALARQVMTDDSTPLQLIVRKQEEPILWADAEEQTLALVITSDDRVEGLLLVHMVEPLGHCQDSLHLLTASANSLSLLAARLADHNRLEAANQVLEHHALHDVLTGLPNRRFLIEMLEDKLLEGERLETQVYIAFIDLDGFKKLNDDHGHDVGDLFLREFAKRLSKVLRGHDLVARYGGDEFVFVGLGSPDDDFAKVSKILVERIRQATTGEYHLGQVRMQYGGPSIGFIEWQPGDIRDSDIAISRADTAMYEDKKRRRNSR
ncbi:MAG: sensor domain-containing diguanylate cyclase [Idiomarina sp.]|nr:sensor domain-containing diguanylate cyclase [Idiomarina sp.]